MIRISRIIERLFSRKNVCKDVSDESLEEELLKHSLLFGLENYKNYSQTSKLLGISNNYLRTIISRYKDKIGEPIHHPTLGNNKLLSIKQISIIKDILKNT